MDNDLFRRGPRMQGQDNLFLWTVFILLLIGFAFACWIGSYYLFGHPENPRSYAILKKINKIEPPKRFELTAAPIGEFLNPQRIYERFSGMSPLELQRENDLLLRNFINNYQNTKKLVPYVIGRFSILDSYELRASDFFPSGIVALAYATDFPSVILEHIYTTPPSNIAPLQRMLMKGLEIKLERTLDLSAVIHAEKLEDGRLKLTVVPLLYGSYALKQGAGSFSLEPPAETNVAAGLPILKTERSELALQTIPKEEPENKAAKEAPTIVRMEPVAKPLPVNPETRVATAVEPEPAAPEPSPEAALPVRPAVDLGAPAAQAAPAATPVRPAVAANAVRALPVNPEPQAATATPPPAGKVPLQPFLAAAPAPNVASAPSSSWRTFTPGQMPRGKLMAPGEVDALAERGLSGERIYLRGSFDVTASGESRAVLRPQGGSLSNLVRGGKTRVIVDFPSGTTPPAEGSSIERDAMRPFQIIDVRRGADGQTNVYVREITTP